MDRRGFLKNSLRLASNAALVSLLPFPAGAASTPIREGIYTSRFTYRAGVDALEIHASLLDLTSVDVTLTHLDGPNLDTVIGVYTIAVDSTQVTDYPGVPSGGVGMYGPQFPVRLALDTQNMESGLYEISIDPLALRPENRENLGTKYVSLNSVSRFVVTAAIPASESRILWLHDPLSGTAYGSFGGESIYGGSQAAFTNVVSFLRPGLDRATDYGKRMVRKFKADGYLFEYMDAIEFAAQSPAFVQNYDLMIVCGKFEYLPHSFFVNLDFHINSGRNLLIASNELGTFRARIDAAAGTMATYKYTADADDPISGSERAGVGMHVPETIWETELTGLTVWSGHSFPYPPSQDMTITNSSDTGWLFDGTGIADAIPEMIAFFNAGNHGVLSQNNDFTLIDTAQSRTPSDTVVWAVTPSTDARKWWEGQPGEHVSVWPIDPAGHAMCTWRETSNGARIIGLPSQQFMVGNYKAPGTKELIENILAYLVVPSSSVTHPIPMLSPLGVGATAAIVAETGRRIIAGHRERPGRSAEPTAPRSCASRKQDGCEALTKEIREATDPPRRPPGYAILRGR